MNDRKQFDDAAPLIFPNVIGLNGSNSVDAIISVFVCVYVYRRSFSHGCTQEDFWVSVCHIILQSMYSYYTLDVAMTVCN